MMHQIPGSSIQRGPTGGECHPAWRLAFNEQVNAHRVEGVVEGHIPGFSSDNAWRTDPGFLWVLL